jgi:hypothetical protein
MLRLFFSLSLSLSLLDSSGNFHFRFRHFFGPKALWVCKLFVNLTGDVCGWRFLCMLSALEADKVSFSSEISVRLEMVLEVVGEGWR